MVLAVMVLIMALMANSTSSFDSFRTRGMMRFFMTITFLPDIKLIVEELNQKYFLTLLHWSKKFSPESNKRQAFRSATF